MAPLGISSTTSIWLFRLCHGPALTQHNILYLPSESNMSTNGKVKHLLIIMLIITVHLAPTAWGFLTQIRLHVLSLFKNGCFDYLKQNWKSLRIPLSQNTCINLSDSHLLLKSTTFKKTSNIRSSKHRINLSLLPAITSRISQICTLKSGCFAMFLSYSGLEKNNIKGAFYPGAPLAPLYHIIHTHTHTHTHARMHAHTHTHTHTWPWTTKPVLSFGF